MHLSQDSMDHRRKQYALTEMQRKEARGKMIAETQ